MPEKRQIAPSFVGWEQKSRKFFSQKTYLKSPQMEMKEQENGGGELFFTVTG